MKKTFKIITANLLLLALIAIAYHFLFGRLFPWSPIKLGYTRTSLARGVIFVSEETLLPEELKALDEILAETEAFHRLQFTKTLRIILPGSSEEYQRRSGAKGLGCTLQTGTAIYLSPEILAEGRRYIDILKHELSHALLFQNTSIRKAWHIPGWFLEGLAVYYGNPLDNFVGEAFRKAAVDDDYFVSLLNPGEKLQKIPRQDRYRFLQSEYRAFLEYLVERFGFEKIIEYMKALIQQPKNSQPLFHEIFGSELEDVVQNFSREVQSKNWPRSEN